MRSRGLLAVVIGACIALCAPAPQADAGTYDVTLSPCNAWGSFGSNGWGNGIYCNGYLAFQLNSNASASVGAPGTYMWLKSPRLPDTTFLKTLKLTYLASQATGTTDHIQARACQRYAGQNDAFSGAPNGACVGAVFGLPSHSAFSLLTIGEGTLACTTNCGGWQLDVSTSYSSGFVWLDGIAATIGDNTAPTVTTSLSSHAISQGNWLRGTVEIGATGNDVSGSGVESMAFYPGDPTLTVSTLAPCDFSNWIPCATVKGWTGSFDTRTVFDGQHSGRYTATDPAGMTGESPTFNYKVDNTKPDTPSDLKPETTGMNGWSATNSFGATWTNGAEVEETTTQSGIEKVIVDVEPTDPGVQTDPGPVTVPVGETIAGVSATKSSVSGVTVPAVGRYVLRVQVQDRAGNVSEATDGSDVSIGFDPSAPAKPAGQSNGWISRDELAIGYDQSFSYMPFPGTHAPVCGFGHEISEAPAGVAPMTVTVPGGGEARRLRLPGDLSESTHYVHLRSISCNGSTSSAVEHIAARVDRTDPVPTVRGAESGHWYQDGRVIVLRGNDSLSGMTAAPDSDPDATHGAYISYAVNGVGPADNSAPRGDSTSIAIGGEGTKHLVFTAVDVAGNRAANSELTFGIDATRPIGYVDPQQSARPTLLSATLEDPVSGIDYAQISIRKLDTSGEWTALPTSVIDSSANPTGSAYRAAVATARFPDTQIKRGTYVVRVVAYDKAGNELETNRQRDGSVASLNNPARESSSLSSYLIKASRTCSQKRCVVRRCSKLLRQGCVKKVRGRFALIGGSSQLSVAHKRGAIVGGVLTDGAGVPLRDQEVTVTATEMVSGKSRPVGSTRTNKSGVYGIRIPQGMNRTIKVSYKGTELREDATSKTRLFTQAKLGLRISRGHARTGQTVTFSGRVKAFDGQIPTSGKIVALQFYAAKKWRPAIAVTHTKSNGSFRIPYKFDGRRVRARIVFRVSAPAENGWGHSASASKPVVVRLN